MAEDGPEGGASLAAALDASLAAAPVRTAPSAQLSPGALLLQFRLWRNAARVLDAGSDRLPFVEFHGAPAVLQTPPPAAETASSPAVPDAVTSPLPFLNVTGFCLAMSPFFPGHSAHPLRPARRMPQTHLTYQERPSAWTA